MKKQTIILMLMLVMVTSVFGQGGSYREEFSNSITNSESDIIDLKPELWSEVKQGLNLRESTVSGLEKAVLVVKNEESKKRLDQVMMQIQSRDRVRLQNATFSEECGQTQDSCKAIAENVENAKLFGLFNTKHSYKYDVSSDGAVSKRSQLSDIFFTKSE